MQNRTVEQYDVIIVGAGTAGCIIAAHLAERGVRARDGEPLKIAMIEAGPYLSGKLRPGYGDPVRRAMFTNIASQDAGVMPRWPWGDSNAKVVGGATLWWGNNGYIPYDLDYKLWMNETGVDWSKDKFRDSVQEIEREWNLGPLPEEVLFHGHRLFRDVVKSMGHDPIPVPFGRTNCLYCGYCGSGNYCKYDSKCNVLGYLWRTREKGLEVVPDAEVEKVTIERRGEKGIVRGVVFKEKDGTVRELRGDRVIVSCGTFGTPVLLARSGYGPREQLGDKTLVHNPNIGQHMQLQPGHPANAYYDFDVKEERGAGNNGDYFWPETTSDGNNIVTIRSTGMGFPTYPQQAALSQFAPRFGQAHKEYMRTAIRRVGSIRITNLTSPVKGSISVHTGEISYPYSDPGNLKVLHRAAEMGWEIHRKMGAKQIDRTLRRSVRGGHNVGTCRAGSDPKESVVNPHFESHDVENLLICDGSVIPRACLSHKCVPVAVLAAFAARRIIANHFTRT